MERRGPKIRSMYANRRRLVKGKGVHLDEKEKVKIIIREIKEQMKKTWVRNNGYDVENGSTPEFGVSNSFGN